MADLWQGHVAPGYFLAQRFQPGSVASTISKKLAGLAGTYASAFLLSGQYSGDTTPVDSSTANGFANVHQVNVNAPLADVNVNRDTGSVHFNVPFVHINKE